MFQIAAKTDYGLLLMLALADQRDRQPRSLRAIAQERHLPYRFLSQIALLLRHAGLIEAKEGTQGGYRLTKKPNAITVGDIVRALEGDVRLVRCHQRGTDLCPSAATCSLSPFWHGVSERLIGTMDTLSLADLLRERSPRS